MKTTSTDTLEIDWFKSKTIERIIISLFKRYNLGPIDVGRQSIDPILNKLGIEVIHCEDGTVFFRVKAKNSCTYFDVRKESGEKWVMGAASTYNYNVLMLMTLAQFVLEYHYALTEEQMVDIDKCELNSGDYIKFVHLFIATGEIEGLK